MIVIEQSETVDHPAAAVFAVLADLAARPTWQAGIVELRVEPPGPVQLGTRLVEVGRYAGHQSEKTLTVSEFEPDCRLTLATVADARAPFREEYELVPLSAESCRVTGRLEIGGVPRIAQFMVRQRATRELPRAFDRLKAILTSRTLAGSVERPAG